MKIQRRAQEFFECGGSRGRMPYRPAPHAHATGTDKDAAHEPRFSKTSLKSRFLREVN